MLDQLLVPKFVSRRVGNWCEESVLQQEKMTEFVTKNNLGQLGLNRAQKKVDLASRPTALSSTFGLNSNIMIQNAETSGFLAVNVPDCYPDTISSIEEFSATSSLRESSTQPTVRSTFQLVQYISKGQSEISDIPRYGDKYHLVLTDELTGRRMFVKSNPVSPTSFAPVSRNQEVKLDTTGGYQSVWEIVFPDPNYRIEMEGMQIQATDPCLIKHCYTGKLLLSDVKHIVRNDFDVEFEVSCGNIVDHGTKLEKPQNIWQFVL